LARAAADTWSFLCLLGSSSSRSARVHQSMLNDMDRSGATRNSTTIGLSRTYTHADTHACTLSPAIVLLLMLMLLLMLVLLELQPPRHPLHEHFSSHSHPPWPKRPSPVRSLAGVKQHSASTILATAFDSSLSLAHATCPNSPRPTAHMVLPIPSSCTLPGHSTETTVTCSAQASKEVKKLR
jgi:hypothetical protein